MFKKYKETILNIWTFVKKFISIDGAIDFKLIFLFYSTIIVLLLVINLSLYTDFYNIDIAIKLILMLFGGHLFFSSIYLFLKIFNLRNDILRKNLIKDLNTIKDKTKFIFSHHKEIKIYYSKFVPIFLLYILITIVLSGMIEQYYMEDNYNISLLLGVLFFLIAKFFLIREIILKIGYNYNLQQLGSTFLYPVVISDLLLLFYRAFTEKSAFVQPIQNLVNNSINIVNTHLPNYILSPQIFIPLIMVIVVIIHNLKHRNPFLITPKKGTSIFSIGVLFMSLFYTLMEILFLSQYQRNVLDGVLYRFSASATAYITREMIAFLFLVFMIFILYKHIFNIKDYFENKKSSKIKEIIEGKVIGFGRFKYAENVLLGWKFEKFSEFILIKNNEDEIKVSSTYNESILYNLENIKKGDKIKFFGYYQKFEDIGNVDFEYFYPEYYIITDESELRKDI